MGEREEKKSPSAYSTSEKDKDALTLGLTSSEKGMGKNRGERRVMFSAIMHRNLVAHCIRDRISLDRRRSAFTGQRGGGVNPL